MPTITKRLSPRGAATKKKAGYHSDGDGLYLQVTPSGARSWVFHYQLRKKRHEMGLGPLRDVPLDEARKRAAEARALLRDGIDPIEHRRAEHRKRALEAASGKTFDACADEYVAAKAAGWRNAKHAAQWASTLKTYASPIIGSLPAREIQTEHIIKLLDPIWQTKPETASRVRGRIEAVLAWATVRGYRVGENPARWRGHLDEHFPARSKVKRVQHHAALPHQKINACMAGLRKREGVAARALEFTILTACRVSEAVGATWAEIDFDTATWTIPAARMKAGRPHRVALSKAALAALRKMQKAPHKDFVFPGASLRKPLTIAAPLKALRDMGHAELTVHGFRSTFRDWAAERTRFERQVVEFALAHVVGDGTEAAYLRTDMLERRRPLMQAWAEYCAKPQPEAKVISFGAAT